jgi:hypothetical protein
MNALKNANPLVVAVGGLVVGLILGLILFWGIIPPKATDVAPVDLQSGYRDFYLSMVAKDYAATKDLTQAKNMLGADRDRWSSKDIAQALTKLAQTPGRTDQAQLNALATALGGSAAATTAKPAAGGTNWALVGCLGLVLVLLLVLGAVWLLPKLQGIGMPKPEPSAAVRGAQATKAVEPTATWAGEAAKPLSQFVTTYEIGDDRYDTSFSVETPTGDFLGECGVGISETVGEGSPNKVAAFEVWLFDKNDIRTVTKVLMSEYAYGDQALRAKLAPKGEPELARPDGAVELETATLKVRARVVEMKYGMGALPDRSYFEKLSLELAAWPKEPPPAPAVEAAA